jgi:hypothetical protein
LLFALSLLILECFMLDTVLVLLPLALAIFNDNELRLGLNEGTFILDISIYFYLFFIPYSISLSSTVFVDLLEVDRSPAVFSWVAKAFLLLKGDLDFEFFIVGVNEHASVSFSNFACSLFLCFSYNCLISRTYFYSKDSILNDDLSFSSFSRFILIMSSSSIIPF